MARRIGFILNVFVITALAVFAGAVGVSAQEALPPASVAPPQGTIPVTFKSLDGVTTLNAYLARPPGDEPRPAVVMMHGCSGLFHPRGRFFSLYPPWLNTLLRQGYVVLVVDSAASRGFGQTCSGVPQALRTMWRDRPKDAYAALAYLQAQPFVRADHVALIGWSQGGGVVLLTINDRSIGRPADLKAEFAAAVAFYPGACDEARQSMPYTRVPLNGWTSRISLLVLFGEADVWTQLKPCAAFLDAAKARGNPVELITYPNAFHSFDSPNMKRTELPQYRTTDGRIPVMETDSAARADAFARVTEFLRKKF